MLRFLLRSYRTLVTAEIALLVVVQTVSLMAYNVAGRWSAAADRLMNIFTFSMFVVIPFYVAFDATTRYPERIPGPRGRAGLYLGVAVNLVAGLVSVVFGFLQAGMSHYVLNQPEATTEFYLLVIPIGLITSLAVGAVVGWGGQLASRIVTRVRA